MPPEVLGDLGYLPEKQNRIESLSLITGAGCIWNVDGQSSVVLSEFKCLRRMFWKGLRSVEDFEALRDCLQAKSEHLDELELDLINWVEADDAWLTNYGRRNGGRSENFFAWDTLKLAARESRITFPSLEALSLSALSLQSAMDELACAFNISGLRSLKLHNCPYSSALLEATVDSSQAIKPTSLELVVDEEDECFGLRAVSRCLEAFEGLQNLYILIHNPEDITHSYWHSILHHRLTLKRLVYHERSTNLDEDADRSELSCDDELSGASGMYSLSHEPGLESIGICGTLSDMV